MKATVLLILKSKKWFHVLRLNLQFHLHCIIHRSLEASALLKATCYLVETLKVSTFNFLGGQAAKLLSVIFTLLLEVLSVTIKLTITTECDARLLSIQKDQSFRVLNIKIKEWIEVVMLAHGSHGSSIFGAGMKSTGNWYSKSLEEFVDLQQEFKVPDYVIINVLK